MPAEGGVRLGNKYEVEDVGVDRWGRVQRMFSCDQVLRNLSNAAKVERTMLTYLGLEVKSPRDPLYREPQDE